MKQKFSTVFLIVFFSISIISCGNKSSTNENEYEENVKNVQYSYDTLQALFISIGENTTTEDIEKYISDNSLEYTLEHYNGGSKTYQLAYTKDTALQSYAEPGDYIEITFDEEEPCKIRVAQYVQNEKPGYSAIYYNHGTFWDFSDPDKMKESYTGYYISDTFGNDEGIIIKYTNGNEADRKSVV